VDTNTQTTPLTKEEVKAGLITKLLASLKEVQIQNGPNKFIEPASKGLISQFLSCWDENDSTKTIETKEGHLIISLKWRLRLF
jgi:hypothetical protein